MGNETFYGLTIFVSNTNTVVTIIATDNFNDGNCIVVGG